MTSVSSLSCCTDGSGALHHTLFGFPALETDRGQVAIILFCRTIDTIIFVGHLSLHKFVKLIPDESLATISLLPSELGSIGVGSSTLRERGGSAM